VREYYPEDTDRVLAQELSYMYDKSTATMIFKATAHPTNAAILNIRGIQVNQLGIKDLLNDLEWIKMESRDQLIYQQYLNVQAKTGSSGNWFYDELKQEFWLSVPSTVNGSLIAIEGISNVEYEQM